MVLTQTHLLIIFNSQDIQVTTRFLLMGQMRRRRGNKMIECNHFVKYPSSILNSYKSIRPPMRDDTCFNLQTHTTKPQFRFTMKPPSCAEQSIPSPPQKLKLGIIYCCNSSLFNNTPHPAEPHS
mmetsp:Transcript_1011/g.1257  ORF Transcript_1011/g.1257 Transcript_1011/m.1257 type:complete len:124 (+) Transcript_1011:26-397(+)